MANFSGAVKIGDLNDFIAPSQACVLKLDGSATSKPSIRATGTQEVSSVAAWLSSLHGYQ
jgi:hypothetical protein